MASETLLTAPNRSTNGIAHGMFMRRQNDSNPPLDHEADYPDLWKPEQSAERNPAEHVEEGVSNMEIVDAIKKVIQDLIVPELNSIKAENREIKVIQELTNKRLDDITAHLIDQSRRIDETNKRIDDTNKRIDDTNKRIDALRVELSAEIANLNSRMDRLYEVIVRREEHEGLEHRLARLEQDVAELRARVAA